MSAFGFSAFVDGFFKGREFRDGREDSKRAMERQDRMDKILADREARAIEMHRLEVQGRKLGNDAASMTMEEKRRAAKQQAEDEAAYQRIMQEGMADAPAQQPLGARPAAASGAPDADAAVRGVAANLPMTYAPSRAAESFVRAVPLASLGAKTQRKAGGEGNDSVAGGEGEDRVPELPAFGASQPPSRAAAMTAAGMGDPSRVMYEDALRRQAGRQGPAPDPARMRNDVVEPPINTTPVNPSYTEGGPDRWPDEQPLGARGQGYDLSTLEAPPPDRRAQFEPQGYPLNTWQAPPRVEAQEAAPAAAMAPPAPQPQQAPGLDRRAQFEPPVDPNRPMADLAAFSPEEIRRSTPGPTLGARIAEATKTGLQGTKSGMDAWAGAYKPNYDHEFGKNAAGDFAEGLSRLTPTMIEAGGAVNRVVGNQVGQVAGGAANTVNRIVNPWSRYIFGVEAPLVPGAPLGPGGIMGPEATGQQAASPPAPSPPAPAAPLAPASPAPAAPIPPASQLGLGPTRKAAAEMQAAQVAQVSKHFSPMAAVAVQAGQEAKGGPLGATPGKAPMTAPQRDRAATSAMDRYTTVVIPRLIEEMVKRGDIDRALKFQAFMEASETKKAMKDYVQMVVAAGEQDMPTFGKHFIAAYNRLGYYNDGTTIVPEQSRFTKDETGAVNGAVITFRNEDTGDTYERVYDDPDQLYLVGLAAADPLNAFEETASRLKSARDAALGARKAQADEAKAAEKERQKNIQDAAKLIFEQSAKRSENLLANRSSKDGTPPPAPLTFAEALEEARSLYAAPTGEPAGTAPPPLLRRN